MLHHSKLSQAKLHQVRSRFKQGFNEVRKRSQSAGPGKFDKKIGKEDSFDQVELGGPDISPYNTLAKYSISSFLYFRE